MWRCDNVGGLCEHVTCHMFRLLSIPFSFLIFTLFFGSRPARTGGPILMIFSSYDVFPRKKMLYGVKSPKSQFWGREYRCFQA